MQVRIKDIMIEKGVSSVSLADMIGVSKVTISNLINNKTMPSVETLDKIATALDVPIWQLFASPEEITGESELTALIQHKGDFYKATTFDELKAVTYQLSDKDNSDRKDWIVKVMRHIFINNYHSIIKKESHEALDDSDLIKDFFSFNEVIKSIETLNEELKQPFTMFLSGYKYSEIAEKLNMPLGTVKSRIFFARQELQKLLTE